MRKHVLLLVSVAMMLLTSMFSMAQTVYFSDGFENGLSAGWTQEYYDVTSGKWVTETPDVSQPWKAESAANGDDLAYPNGAAVGKGRAYFRQEAAPGKNVQTTGYRTRLITPAMDLMGYQPILRFYHAQAKWTADFDTLRVYYRYGTEDWELLSEYTSPIQKWKFEELDLPHTGENYQLAFEADENMGRGIVLDSVIVRTKPQITTPHDLGYYDMRDNGINLTWQASKDADYFRIILAEMDLDLNVIPSNIDSTQYIVVDTIIDSDFAQDIRVEDLASGRTYYMLAQSIGEFENSAWSETFSFRMKPVVNITATEGFFEDFTIKYKSNLVPDMQKETWTWGGDKQPIIPMWVGEENFYMYSPDASCAVVFTGQNTSSSGELTYTVPKGQVQYIVSPEISGKDLPGFSMSMCHVTFWGTTYKYQHNRAKAIIVGIATDPEDPTTFVPVDTCEVWGFQQFTFFDVDLSSYEGNGRYVVFATNFQDKDNWFALDKVTIELKPAISSVKASDIRVIPTNNEVHMTWPAVEGAVKYRVKLKAMERKGAKVPLYESLMAGAYTYETTTNEFIYNDLTARTKFTYCVQAVGTDTVSAWSQPREFYTSAEISIPKTYEFEESEGTYSREGEAASELFARDWCIFTNDADAPYLYTSYYKSGTRCLYLVKDQYNDAWTVAPMIDDLQNVEIVLYARLSSTSYPNSNVVVGVMEDPSDLKTFTPITTFTPSGTNYERFYANFTNYKGTGKYIALLWGESGVSKNGLCIDDLSIRPLASCFAPTIEAQVTDSSAILRWTRKDETDKYTIKVCRVPLSESQILTATGDTIVAEYEGYNDDTLQLKGLQFSTQYYVYAQTVCSESDQSDWVSMSFKTDCPEKMSLPYKNDFESENYSGSNSIPACWLKPTWTTTSSVYPYLSSSYNHTSELSGNCLYMYSSTTYGSTIALPKIDADLENVKLRFWAYYSSAGYKIFAGLMGDPSDPTDFYPVDTFETVASTWVLCEAMFTAEDLKHGSYLAISSYTGASNYAYIDDIEVINVIDAAPFNYKKVDAGTNWFEVKWDGRTSDKWKVIISDKSYALEGDFDPEDMIPADSRIVDTQVATNGYKVEDGLQSLTWYYIYAKSSVGSEWSMDSIQTECTVWNPRVKMVQGFEVDAAGNDIRSTTSSMSTTTTYVNYFKNAKEPECWTVGNAKYGADPSQRNSSGYIPYICTDGAAASETPTAYAESSAVGNQFSTDGVNSLKVYSYYSSTASSNQAPAWAAMNKLDCSNEDLKSLILTFDYQMATTAAYAIVVGIMDDPTDLSTFTVLDSIPGSKGTGTGYHKHASYEISLEDYQGTGRYIAFRGRYGATTIFYLDNVSVNLASCPNPKPSMSQITDNSAVVSSGLRVPNSWKYIVTDTMYQAANLDAGTMPAPEHIIEQGTVAPIEMGEDAPKSKRISNLAPKTDYYVYATTLCENDEISAWKMVSFSTLCAPTDAADWMGNFANDTTVSGYTPECWTVGSLTAGAAATYIPYVVNTTRAEDMEDPESAKLYNKTTGAVTGAKVLRLYAYSTTSVGAYAISPAINIPEGKTLKDYQIMFKGYGTSAQSGTTTTTAYAHNLRVGMIEDPSDLSKMVILDTVALPTNTQQCVVELSGYNGNGKHIIFLLEKEVPTYSQAYIYGIHLAPIPACKTPGGIKLDTIGDTFIKASWNGNASQYNVAISQKLYKDAQKADGILLNDSVIAADGIVFKTATGNSITFDGLEPNSVYYLYVQGKCSESEMSLWAYESPMIHTECIAEQPVPLKETFEKYTTSPVVYAPDCWKYADYMGTGYPKVMNPTSGAVSGHQYELWSTGTTHRTVVMLPKVVGNLRDYIFSMDARSYSTTTASVVYVGTMSDINDSATFVPMDTFYMDGGNEFTHVEMELSKYNVVHDHIAITSGLGMTLEKASDIYIDNIRLGYPISCFAPKDVAISNPGLTSADLSFTPNSETDNKWEIELTKIGGGKQTFVTTQPSYSFENLDPASAYSVIVRTDCDGDYSDYTDAITFNTKWQIDTYKWTFNKDEQGTISVPNKAGAAVATYTVHPALTPTGSLGTLNYSSNTTYLPYQIMNTTALAYAQDKRDFVAGGDTARAMRLYRYVSTSTIAYGDSAAVILPYVVNPQGKQISMDLRFGYAYASNHSTATYQDVVNTTYPKGILCIGTVDSLATDLTTYQEITRVYAHPMLATDTLSEASDYGWMHYVHPLDMNLAGKQLVLMIQASATANIYIDNLAIEMTGAEGSLTTPVITSVSAGDTYATVNWTGNAESYNIYVVDTAKAACGKYIPYIQDAPDACVDTIKNVSGNSYKVTGLTAGGNTYAFYVEDAGKAAMNGALSNRAFATTVCEAIVVNGSYSYDFEPGAGYKMGANPSKSTADGFTFQWPTSTTASDTVYKTPDCWTIGMTYVSYDPTSTTYKSYKPSLRSNSMTAAAASQYRYARSGYSAMMFPCSSTTYMEGYAVMPLMTGYDSDTMEINFWGRCTYEKVQGGTIYTTSYLKGTSYSTKMIVGTMTDPEDPATFVALDTVEYDYTASDMTTSTPAADDPAGNNYWLNFTVPMKGATGSYIAFRQHDHGYFYMDDLKIQKRQTPRRPRNLEVVELGSTTATISWMGEEMAEGGKYIIQISSSPTNWDGVRNDTTTLETYQITGLEVSTKYYVRVKQEGSIYGNTDFAHYVEFTTECLPLNPNGYKTGFECDNEIDPWVVIPGATGTNVNTLKQNQCWTYWAPRTNSTSVTSGYRPYNIVNTASTGYSHSGNYAVTVYATPSTVQQAIVSPLINAELGVPGVGFDTLQVSFWVCPSYHGLSGTNKDKISSAQGNTYAKYIEIGTCTDPTDTTTYTVLQGYKYEVEDDNLKTGTQADASNDYAFRKVTVKLNEATGPYVFIRAQHVYNGKSYSYSRMYIDDLQFEKLLNCPIPENLEAVNVSTHGAQVQWTGDALTYDVQVSSDPTFTDDEKLIGDENVETTVFVIEGLEPAKQYYYRVKAYCDAAKKDASDWTMTANFNTPYAPMYEENFTMSLGEWRMAYGYANKVFAGKAVPRDTTSSSTYNSWYRIQNLAMSGYAVRSLLGYAASANPTYPISSTYQAETYYQKYWLISPSITLEHDSARLAFLACLTNYTTADPITVHSHWNEGWDDQFMVIISEDDGKTWKRENAVVWNNETSNDPSDAHYKYGIGDYVLTDIPAEPTQLYVDLNKYTGKTIRVAFYAENTDQNAMNAIHVDQIHINYAVTKKDAITLCQYEDVEDILGFNINGDTVSAGPMKLERSVLGSEDVKDSLYILDVNYLEAPQYYYEMTVCAGHPFEYMGFNQHTKPGIYRMKLKSQVTGCDSIVNFVLRHADAFRTTIDTTICYGSSIVFNGQTYSEAGTYTATYQSSAYLGGCDSIVTLNLSLTDPIVTNVNKSICQGDEYDWEEAGMTLSKAGTYTHTFPAANGCDSVVNLTLTVHRPVYGYQEVSMPQGGSYNWDNEVYTTDGAYPKYGTSKVTGCDSITMLILHIIPAPVDTTYDAYCEGSSYTFYGKQYSEVGVYRDTTYAEETHYMAIHELHLSRNPILSSSLGTKYINEGSVYNFNGKPLMETAMYYDTIPSTITGCDSIVSLNLIALPPAIYNMHMTVCSSELPIQWKDTLIEKAGTYRFDTLTVYETDSIIYLTLDVIQPTTSSINASFCEGGSYELNGKTFAVAGTYYDTLPSLATGCDSIITLVLTQTPAPVSEIAQTICAGESYAFGDKQLTAQGVYRDTTYAEGTHCMEITELTLTVNPRLYNNLGTKYIKLGSSYDFYGKMISETGMYYDTVPSVQTGCDSINSLNLIALAPVHSSMSITVCSNELPIEWKGMTLTEAGAYHFDTLTVHETDSIIDLTFEVIQPRTATLRESFCEGGSYELNGKTFAVAGTYYDTLTSLVTGCDSIITLVLTQTPAPVNVLNEAFCEGSSYDFGGKQLKAEGVYRDTTYAAVTHCMEITELHLSMNPIKRHNLGTEYINLGETYSFYGKDLTESGIYYDTLTSVAGCDSINYLNLVVLTNFTGYESKTVCASELPIEWKDKVIDKEGTYTFDTLTVHGTDSIVNLTLEVIQPTTATLRESFCEGGSYELNGKSYAVAGTYYDTVPSLATGCDSIITLVLTRNAAPVNVVNDVFCEGRSYDFGSKQLTAEGVYRDTTYAAVTHCMEITELHLSMNPIKRHSLGTEYIKAGSSYDFYGKMISETGMYYDTVPSVETGCDSINYLQLWALEPVHSRVTISICPSELPYTWKGMTLEAAGQYHFDTLTVHQTDSIIDLTLNVIQPTTSSINASFCEGGSYELNGKSYAVAGTYYDTVPSLATGCDSIITLVLTRNAAPVNVVNDAYCEGSSYEFGGKQLSAPGVYRDTTYAAVTHCMEITELHLSMNPIKRHSLGTEYIKAGSSYDFYGKMISESGMYYDTVPSVETGCDSINSIQIWALSPVHSYESKTVCSSELPITWKGKVIDKAGAYQFDTLTVHQTDSVIHLTLEVTQPVYGEVRESFCEGGSYVLNGKTYSAAGTYKDTIPSLVTGCDSIITLVLTQTPASVIPARAAICEGGSYTFGGKVLTQDGIYRDTTYAEGTHCMEITELTLAINHPVTKNVVVTICAGGSYEFGDKELTEAGDYVDTLISVAGCDSIVNLRLNVATVAKKDIAKSICAGSYYEFGGKKLTEAGIYYDTLRSTLGCDSIIIKLELSVNEPTTYDYDYVLCAGGTYDFFGKELSAEGTYSDTILNSIGCDSIITVHITISEPLKGTKYAEYCGEAYIYEEGDGNAYTEGTHEVWLKTEAGCDSIVTLILTQTFDVHDTLYVTMCAGDIYSDEHFTVEKPGTYYYEETQMGGCTYYHVLYFDNYPTEMSIDTTVLVDDLPTLILAIPDEYKEYADSIIALISEPGDYADSIEVQTPAGCDFTIFVTLHVKEAMSIRDIYEDENGQKVLKVLYRERLYIIRQDGWYNAAGQKVENPIR